MAVLASCASQPGPETVRTSSYRNIHRVQFEYPSSWQLQDMSKSYGSLEEAQKEGAAYIQVYSYDPTGVQDPAEAVSPGRIKIAILFERNLDKLDYSKVLARMENRIVEKTLFRVHGREAYRVIYWITSEETGGRLKVLSIEYLDQDLYVRFLCYPWNYAYQKEFEDLARSFRYKGM